VIVEIQIRFRRARPSTQGIHPTTLALSAATLHVLIDSLSRLSSQSSNTPTIEIKRRFERCNCASFELRIRCNNDSQRALNYLLQNSEAEDDHAAARRPIYTMQRWLEHLWVSKRLTMP
jgi:hypothetical protein